MSGTTLKRTILALILASAVPLAACSDDNDNPTAPTQPGPPVSDAPPPAPPPAPEPPPPDPPPAPEPPPTVTIAGVIVNLARTGEGGLDASFRIDDFTIVRVSRTTPVVSGSQTGDTNYLREGQTVTVQGTRTNGFLDASRVEITAQAP